MSYQQSDNKRTLTLTWEHSRPSRTADWDYDFFVDFDAKDASQVQQVIGNLRKHTADVRVLGSDSTTKGEVFLC